MAIAAKQDASLSAAGLIMFLIRSLSKAQNWEATTSQLEINRRQLLGPVESQIATLENPPPVNLPHLLFDIQIGQIGMASCEEALFSLLNRNLQASDVVIKPLLCPLKIEETSPTCHPPAPRDFARSTS